MYMLGGCVLVVGYNALILLVMVVVGFLGGLRWWTLESRGLSVLLTAV